MRSLSDSTAEVVASEKRRRFLKLAVAGTTVAAMGGIFVIPGRIRSARVRGEKRQDGRARLPPGQTLITRLKPMGGQPGDPSPSAWHLRVHGEVARPFMIDFAQLRAMPQSTQQLDVHCVTGWSRLDVPWVGVRLVDLAERAGVNPSARHVVFEAARGYTANLRLEQALAPQNLVAHRVDGAPLAQRHGAPVRAVVPDLYFWKSAKWLTGIRFVARDRPGYWEVRGYNNHADPWKEERYA